MNGLQYIRKAYGMSLDTLGKRMGDYKANNFTVGTWYLCKFPEVD